MFQSTFTLELQIFQTLCLLAEHWTDSKKDLNLQNENREFTLALGRYRCKKEESMEENCWTAETESKERGPFQILVFTYHTLTLSRGPGALVINFKAPFISLILTLTSITSGPYGSLNTEQLYKRSFEKRDYKKKTN